MTDTNRLLKRILPGTVRYVTDNHGNKTAFESYDRKLTVRPGSGAQMDSCPWANVMAKPDLFPTTWEMIENRPTLFSGSYSDLSNVPAQFDGKWTSITGKPTFFSGSYNDLTNKPTIPSQQAQRRIDTYTGKTDTNGLYTVTYPTPFPSIPSVQPEPPAMPNQVWVKVNSTLTGFSLRLVQRNTVNLLNIEVLLGATVNVANADARVVVIAA